MRLLDKAKFGDRYLTRGGKLAIYWCKIGQYHRLICDNGKSCSLLVDEYGRLSFDETNSDIVKKLEEVKPA